MSDAAHDHGHTEQAHVDGCCAHDHGHADHADHAEHSHAEHGHADKGHGGSHDDCCGHDHGHGGHAEHGHVEPAHDNVHGHDNGHGGHGHAHGPNLTAPPSVADGDDVCGDAGLFKKVLREGDADLGSPPAGSEVSVHYTGTLLDGSKFDSSVDRGQKFKFTIGQGQVIKGWDEGVATMKKGERAILTCREDYAYGARGSPPKIPGGATLKFEVELFSWKEKRKARYELQDAEVIPEATTRKAKGTEHFKAGHFDSAAEDYADAASLLEGETGDEAKALLLSCLLNQATCALKLGGWAAAAEAASKALDIDAASVKALFRRGHAQMELGQFESALADLREANKLDPKSKEVREMFAACKEKEKEVARRDRELYSKMMGAK